MSDDIAAFEKQFTVKRDADRTSRGLRAIERRHRPALNTLDLGDFPSGHDDDLVAACKPSGFDPAGDDTAIVEFVDRLNRQPQCELFRWLCRLKLIERVDHSRTTVPAKMRRVRGNAVAVAGRNRNHRLR